MNARQDAKGRSLLQHAQQQRKDPAEILPGDPTRIATGYMENDVLYFDIHANGQA